MFESLPLGLRVALLVGVGLYALRAFFAIVIVTMSMRERRLVMPYVPFAPNEPFPETPYAAATNALAAKLEFRHLGAFRDGKGTKYAIRYDLWISPDNTLLAVVGGGKLAGIPVDGTWMYGRLADSRAVVTTDKIGGLELYANGLVEGGMCLNADLYELVGFHRGIVDRSGSEAVAFGARDPLGDFVRLRAGLVGLMVADGHVSYLDESEGAWHYTLKGGIRRATKGQRATHEEARRNADRMKIVRPGAAGYVPSWERDGGPR
jgi:hypothetical protein